MPLFSRRYKFCGRFSNLEGTYVSIMLQAAYYDTKLQCDIESYPAPAITWTKVIKEIYSWNWHKIDRASFLLYVYKEKINWTTYEELLLAWCNKFSFRMEITLSTTTSTLSTTSEPKQPPLRPASWWVLSNINNTSLKNIFFSKPK